MKYLHPITTCGVVDRSRVRILLVPFFFFILIFLVYFLSGLFYLYVLREVTGEAKGGEK